MSPSDFFSAVYNKAIELGANDVQARLAASQASEETGFGQSMVGGNLFGIKAGTNYTGPSVTASTEEEYNGNTVRENANFRAYDNFTDSVKDYLGMIQQNFPDAWSAPTFSDAVQGLQNGVFGAYATRAAYPQHLTAIDKKYGAFQFAQDPENVPVPYGPSDQVDLTGLPDDAIPVADPNFVEVDPQFSFAANPSGVPLPEFKPDLAPAGVLAGVNAEPATAQAAQQATENEWGVLNGVAPALVPTLNSWAPVAEAKPVQAPMGSVTAEGVLSGVPAQSAQTTVDGLTEPSTVSSRMGLAEPNFDKSRFDGLGISVADGFDEGRFATPSTSSFDPGRFAGVTIDPATNTTSFANPAGVLAQQETVTAPGVLAGIDTSSFDDSRFGPSQAAFDQARFGDPLVNPISNVTSFTEEPATPPAAAATEQQASPSSSALISPTSIASMTPSFTPAAYSDVVASVPVDQINQAGFVNDLSPTPDVNLEGKIVPGAQTVQAPALDTVEVSDQPSVTNTPVSIPGPATTSAADQQQAAVTETAPTTVSRTTTTKTAPTASDKRGVLSGLFSKEALGGGVLAGLLGGPLAAPLGVMAGTAVANNGGLTGLLSPQSFSAPTNQIAGGVNNIAGIYGGTQAPGTYAVASNGATITAQPGGYTTYTNKYGVTETIGPDGKISSTFGYDPDEDTDQDAAA